MELVSLANIIIGLIAVTVALVVGFYVVVPAREKIRRDFRELQPNIQLAGTSVMSLRERYTVNLRLHNRGGTAAHDATVTMDGWPGRQNVSVIHEFRPGRSSEREVAMELGLESAIRTTSVGGAQLHIRYRDRWNNWYELSYPVVQELGDHGLFNIRIPEQQPNVKRPPVSFRKMRQHLRETPSP